MKILFVSVLCLWATSSFSQSYLTEKGDVAFISKAAVNEFEGKSQKLKGLIDLDKNLVDFYLELNTLKTGIGLRDRHMRENYLETDTYPFAEFTGKFVEPLPTPQEDWLPVVIEGVFKIHGQEKPIKVDGKLKRSGDELLLETEFEVLLSDFQIEIPKLVFFELAEKQLVQVKATLSEQKK